MSENEIAEAADGPEREIARIRITPEKSHIKALIDMVTGISVSNGMQTSAAERLDRILADIIENIVAHGFEGDTRKPVEVIIYRRLHSLVIAVEDKGLPFDYDKLEKGEEKRFKSYMSRHYADEVRFRSLGKGGNRTEIIKNLPYVDIREVMDIAEHHEHAGLPDAPGDEKIGVAMLDTNGVHELVRLVFKCYGYTYANDFMYVPEQIESLLKSGLMLSSGAYNSRTELVGHVGFIFSAPGARVAESGEAVVDPRYRGCGLFQMMKNYLKDFVTQQNVVGIYGEAVTVHPYSQKGSIELGGRETGFLLGYSPGTVKFESISEDERPRRQSVALLFTPLLPSGPTTIYVPEAYGQILAEIYERLGYGRNIVPENAHTGVGGRSPGAASVSIRHDHNQARIIIEKIGGKTVDEIRFHLKHLTLERFDCIYVDLPLKQKGAGYVGSVLRDTGFFFGCVIPEYGDGDVLRLQYLNNVEISRDDIKTASGFGRKLLDTILDDMERAGSGFPLK
ncbi:MAG: ATP-binding protein [Candidatus Dadabacteria bacterium]|nr:ATP-binding protein [Candidatus Dadabacteria bacterium]